MKYPLLLLSITLCIASIFSSAFSDTISPEKYYEKGESLFNEKKYDEAIECFRMAITSENITYKQQGYAYLGYCYEMKSDMAAAVAHYRKALSLKNDYQFVLEHLEALLLRGKINPDEAIECFRIAITSENTTDKQRGFAYLGYCYEIKSDTAAAVEHYRKALSLNNDYQFVLEHLGALLLRGKINPDEGAVLLRKAHQKNWLKSESYYLLAVHYSLKGESAKAVTYIDLSAGRHEQSIDTLMSRIKEDISFNAIRNYDGYINLVEQYDNLLKIGILISNNGDNKFSQRKYREALELYERALEYYRKAESGTGLYAIRSITNLGLTYFETGDLSKSYKCYEELSKYIPQFYPTPERYLKFIANIILFINQSSEFIPNYKDNQGRNEDLKNADHLLTPQTSHCYALADIKISYNGKYFATSAADGTIKLWTHDGLLLREMFQFGSTCIAFNSDSSKIISGGLNSIIIWNMEGKPHVEIKKHAGRINSLAVTNDDKYIITGLKDKTVQIWSFDGKLVKTLDGHKDTVSSVAVSPDSTRIASCSKDGTIRTWKITGEPLKTFSDVGTAVEKVMITPDGKNIVSLSKDNKIRTWNWDGNLLVTSSFEKIPVDFIIQSDGRHIMVFLNDGSIQVETIYGYSVYKIQPDKTIARITIDNLNDAPLKLVLSHTSDIIVTTYFGGTIKILDSGGKVIRSISSKILRPWSIAPILKGKGFITTSGNIMGATQAQKEKQFCSAWSLEGKNISTSDNNTIMPSKISTNQDYSCLATVSADGVINYLDGTGKIIRSFQTGSDSFVSVDVSTDGKYIAAGEGIYEHLFGGNIKDSAREYKILIWDNRGVKIKEITAHKLSISGLKFSPDGQQLISASLDGTVKIWDMRGNLISVVQGIKNPVNAINLSIDGKTLVIGDSGGIIYFYHLDKHALKEIESLKINCASFSFSPDGKYLSLTNYKDTDIYLLDCKGKLVKKLVGHSYLVWETVFTPDNKRLLSVSEDGTARVWNIETGDQVIFATDGVEWIVYTPDGYFDCSPNGGKMLAMVRGAEACGIDQFALTKNRPDIILRRLGSYQRELIDHYQRQYLRRIAKHNLLPQQIEKSKFEEIIASIRSEKSQIQSLAACYQEKGGYYAMRSDISYTERRKILDISWFSDYVERYLSGSLVPPETKIISANQDESLLSLEFSLKSSENDLLRYNVYINDVPLFGAGGQEVAGREALLRQSIKLCPGANKIEVSCTDNKGMESYRALHIAVYEPKIEKICTFRVKRFIAGSIAEKAGMMVGDMILKVDGKQFTCLEEFIVYIKPAKQYNFTLRRGTRIMNLSIDKNEGRFNFEPEEIIETSTAAKGDLYYIGFGVSKYKDSSLELQYAHKDALDLARVFKKMEGKKYKNVYCKTYTNSEVTTENIKKAKEILKNAKVEDTFVLFIAGHGMHDHDKEATYYFLTYNADIKKLSKTAANFELVEDLLQGIPPRNKLFFMDTCESGEQDDAVLIKMRSNEKSRGVRARAVKRKNADKRSITVDKKRPYVLERDRFIYNDLYRRSGAIVFSSCKGNEVSYEDDRLKNGFFTAAIKHSFTSKNADKDGNGIIDIDELRDFVSQEVPRICKEFRFNDDDYQHPTVDRDNLYIKFGFPIAK